MKLLKFFAILSLFLIHQNSKAQINLIGTPQINTVCNGIGCNYIGPSILINEVMLKPAVFDGSIYGDGPGFSPNSNSGEWIELYNPDQCKSVDISCYYLGNNSRDNGIDYPGGFVIPPGTIIPPRGFYVVRGANSSAVPAYLLGTGDGQTQEIVVNNLSQICIGGGLRLWFPNAGGWFAFYNSVGAPQDAISWADMSLVNTIANPCVPNYAGCSYAGLLPAYSNIPAANKMYIANNVSSTGLSFQRSPDGGNWTYDVPANPTFGYCNAGCIPAPVITCTGSATVLASGGTPPYSYHWNDGQLQTTSTAVGLCAGVYCVTVNDATSNTSTTCVTVTSYQPIINATGNDEHCNMHDGNATVTNSVGSGNYSYSWNTSPVQTTQSISGLSSGTYIVTFTDNTCVAKDTVVIGVIGGPQILINNIIPDTCNKSVGSVSASVNSGVSPYVYSWNTTPAQNILNIQNVHGGTYNLSVTDANNCVIVANVTIPNIPGPQLLFSTEDEHCGLGNGSVTVNAFGGTGIYTYSWSTSPQEFTNQIINLHSGSYTVTVDDGICEISQTVFVNNITDVTALFSVSPSVLNIMGSNTAYFLDESVGATNWQWNFGDGSSSLLQNNSHIYQNVGNYIVTLIITDDRGCTDTIQKEIIVNDIDAVYFPNSFTPNNDGLNDTYGPVGYNIEMGDFVMYIYNRWGEEVYKTRDFTKRWNGTINNTGKHKDIVPGIYVYYAVITEKVFGQSREYKGIITIVR